ncbi:MAG: MFS transporter [Armatimonadota bacterium]|nr:MFS transporter [Armatimonadota bacterium]MDR7437447.1 MFS transporter [Armatimonadota bacterium]MDR7473198.1 MFS transporter [Armatimonadota bacterium]MDR7506956.1 MFS transporter [Armatimonadota bacterium]MDR7509355.1 MFS transporter [Armatimonadota bacterium]
MDVLRRWLRVPLPPRTRAVVRLDMAAAFLYGAFAGLTQPFIPVMGVRLGATPLQVSLLVAAPAVVFLLSFWVVNAVRPVHPVRLVMGPALAGRALFLLMPLVRSPRAYVLLVILYHAVNSVNPLGYAQVMRTVYPDDARGRIMALVKVVMAAAWVAGSLVGGSLMQRLPFQWVFAAAGILGMASAVVFGRIRLPRPAEHPEHIPPGAAARVLRDDPGYRRFLLAFFVFGFGGWLTGPAVPLLLVRDLRASNLQVGLLGAVTSATWVLSFYSWGRMIDRRTATGALKVVFTIGTLTPLIYLVAPNPWVVLLAGITDGLASAGIDLGWLAAVLHYAPPGRVLLYTTLFNTLVGVRAAVAPVLAGSLIPRVGVRAIFAIAAAFYLLGTVLMRRVPPPPQAGRTGPASTG